MTRVISSPSRSATGFFTLILFTGASLRRGKGRGGGDGPIASHPSSIASSMAMKARLEKAKRPAKTAPWKGTTTRRSVARAKGAMPAVILVHPQLGENIGKAARAMLNFGLTDLRLVAPRDGGPAPAAVAAAAGAEGVVGQARVFDTVADAVADCAHVYATTVRKRGLVIPIISPEEAG